MHTGVALSTSSKFAKKFKWKSDLFYRINYCVTGATGNESLNKASNLFRTCQRAKINRMVLSKNSLRTRSLGKLWAKHSSARGNSTTAAWFSKNFRAYYTGVASEGNWFYSSRKWNKDSSAFRHRRHTFTFTNLSWWYVFHQRARYPVLAYRTPATLRLHCRKLQVRLPL